MDQKKKIEIINTQTKEKPMPDFKQQMINAVANGDGIKINEIAHAIMAAEIELEDLFDEKQDSHIFEAVAKHMKF